MWRGTHLAIGFAAARRAAVGAADEVEQAGVGAGAGDVAGGGAGGCAAGGGGGVGGGLGEATVVRKRDREKQRHRDTETETPKQRDTETAERREWAHTRPRLSAATPGNASPTAVRPTKRVPSVPTPHMTDC